MATMFVAIVSCSQYITDPGTQLKPVVTQTERPVTNLTISTEKILNSHNLVRERLGVPPLRWSSRLEAKAAEWANYLSTDGNCIPRKRGLLELAGFKNGLGENVLRVEPALFGDGRSESANVDESSVLLTWAQQGIDYNYKDNKCRLNKTCENYTQVVWRDSQVVGCAAASCPNSSQMWVCNYDPPGNFLGQKPY